MTEELPYPFILKVDWSEVKLGRHEQYTAHTSLTSSEYLARSIGVKSRAPAARVNVAVLVGPANNSLIYQCV